MTEDNTRGFYAFIGKTIQSIDASAINVVRITFTDGDCYEIWAEDRHYDIEVIKAIKEETNVTNQ